MAFHPTQQPSMPNREPQLLSVLSSFCSPQHMEELYDYFTSFSKNEIMMAFWERRRDSKPLSSSQRSSLLSIFSYVSSSSTDSWESVPTAAAYPDFTGQAQGSLDQFHHDSSKSFATRVTSPHASLQNQDSPYPGFSNPAPHAEADNMLHVCIMCRKRYDSGGKLTRHRTDECESKGIWVCPSCPMNKPQEFKRPDGLRTHFQKHHQGVCGQECNSRDTDNMRCSTHQPNLDVETAFRPHPQKKAWGCAVCEICFDSDDGWHEHEKTHRKDVILPDKRGTDITVKGWSKRKLIHSLLFKSKDLQHATSSYDWNLCKWPLDEDAYKSLIFALERHTLPNDLRSHHQYEGLAIEEALVMYTFRMGLSGTPHSPQNLAIYCRKSAVSLASSSFPAPDNTISSPPSRGGTNSQPQSQPTGYTAYHPSTVQESVTTMEAPLPQRVSLQSPDSARDGGRSVHLDRQRQTSQGPSQESQRPKSRGGIFNIIRSRSKSFSHRVQENSPLQPPPALPLPLSTQPSHEMAELSSFFNSYVGSPCELEIRPIILGSQAGLHEASVSTSSRIAQNVGEQTEEKRQSKMSFVWTSSTDTEIHNPGSSFLDKASQEMVTDSYGAMDGFLENYEKPSGDFDPLTDFRSIT